MSLDTDHVWRAFGESLRAFLARRAPADRVDDLLQEVFLRIHRGLDGLADEQHLAAWVHRIARNVLTDAYRRRRREAPLDAGGACGVDAAGRAASTGSGAPLADEPLARAPADELPDEVATAVARMAERLPDTFRDAVLLHERDGLSQQEVADRLGLSLSGAKSRIQRGRDHLRGMILACCHVEFDARRRPVAFVPRSASCPACCEDDGG